MLSLLLTVGFCSADTFNLDFTQSDPWAAMNGRHSYTNVYTTGYSVTLNALPSLYTLRQTSAGIGIGPIQNDEIGFTEALKVSLAPPVEVSNVTVDKLFIEWFGPERGEYQINGTGAWTDFSSNGTGTRILDINQQVNSITFRIDGVLSDFAVQGMQVSVPDGGMTLMLLGGALVGLETLRRKFRA